MVQAIVGMWRKVGIEAEIEVYEIAKHYELRATDTLAPAAFTTGAMPSRSDTRRLSDVRGRARIGVEHR